MSFYYLVILVLTLVFNEFNKTKSIFVFDKKSGALLYSLAGRLHFTHFLSSNPNINTPCWGVLGDAQRSSSGRIFDFARQFSMFPIGIIFDLLRVPDELSFD